MSQLRLQSRQGHIKEALAACVQLLEYFSVGPLSGKDAKDEKFLPASPRHVLVIREIFDYICELIAACGLAEVWLGVSIQF